MGITYNSLIKKIAMALTGLFLAFFLVIHLAGNLQLLMSESVAHVQFNEYSKFLSGLLPIKIVSYLLYISILYHIIDALIITLGNRKANSRGYKSDNRSEVSGWASRNMGILGSVLTLFLILHFKDYWWIYKFGELPLDANGNKDLYLIVMTSFQQLWYVGLYVIAFLALGFHLWHGVSSAFRTMGLYNQRYIRWVKYLGYLYTLVITIGFIIIPIISYINQL